MASEIAVNSSSQRVCDEVCSKIGHRLILIDAGEEHSIICGQCGMSIEQIRGEDK